MNCHPKEENREFWRGNTGSNGPLSPVKSNAAHKEINFYQNARNNEGSMKSNIKRRATEPRSPRPPRKFGSPMKKNSMPISPTRKLTSSTSSSDPSSKSSSLSMSPSKLKSSEASSSSSASTEPNSPKKSKSGHGRSKSGSYQVSSMENGSSFNKYRINEIVHVLDEQNVGKPRLTSWKDISPSESKSEGIVQIRTRPESGYFSNEVYSESREEIDGEASSTDSDCHVDTIKLRPPRHKQDKAMSGKSSELNMAGGKSADQVKVDAGDIDCNEHSVCLPSTEIEEIHDCNEQPNESLALCEQSGDMIESDSVSQSEYQENSQDDTLNDYFFDEDFIVNSDGRLHASIGVQLQGSCGYALADSMGAGK